MTVDTLKAALEHAGLNPKQLTDASTDAKGDYFGDLEVTRDRHSHFVLDVAEAGVTIHAFYTSPCGNPEEDADEVVGEDIDDVTEVVNSLLEWVW